MLPELRAERQLAAIEAAAVPHMTAATSREVVASHARHLNRERNVAKATESDLAAIGITVEHVVTSKEKT